MKNYIMLDGKKIPLSQETEQSLRDAQEQDYKILKVKGVASGIIKDYHERICVNNNSCHSIYSVRRLSDGEVFEVGDKVRHEYGHKLYNNWKISSIRLVDDKVQLYSGTGFHKELSEIKHRKEEYVVCVSNDYSYVPWSVFHTNKRFTNDRHFKRFPTEEKAQEYIDNHKPKYSKADIEEAIQKISVSINGGSWNQEIFNISFDKFWKKLDG